MAKNLVYNHSIFFQFVTLLFPLQFSSISKIIFAMASHILFALLSLVAMSSAFFDIDLCNYNNKDFDGRFKTLAMTLGVPDILHPLNARYWFNNVPQTESEAVSKNWTKLTSSDCQNGGAYSGIRYVPPSARSVAALYDSQGVVAGFQMLANKEKLLNPKSGQNNYDFEGESFINTETFNLDGQAKEYFVLTAYFAEPSTICSSTKNPTSVSTEGFGTELYFQNGPASTNVIAIPQKRSEASAQGWRDNKCLPMNGFHNFYQVEKWQETDCRVMRPIWLLYDCRGDLSGFGFTLPGLDDSPRFQHPPGLIVQQVIKGFGDGKCARYIADSIKFTNINVYLNSQLEGLKACI